MAQTSRNMQQKILCNNKTHKFNSKCDAFYCTCGGTVLPNVAQCLNYQYFASSQALPDCPSDEISFVDRDQYGSFVE